MTPSSVRETTNSWTLVGPDGLVIFGLIFRGMPAASALHGQMADDAMGRRKICRSSSNAITDMVIRMLLDTNYSPMEDGRQLLLIVGRLVVDWKSVMKGQGS